MLGLTGQRAGVSWDKDGVGVPERGFGLAYSENRYKTTQVPRLS